MQEQGKSAGWVWIVLPESSRVRDAVIFLCTNVGHTRKRTMVWLGFLRSCLKVPTEGVKRLLQEDKPCCSPMQVAPGMELHLSRSKEL